MYAERPAAINGKTTVPLISAMPAKMAMIVSGLLTALNFLTALGKVAMRVLVKHQATAACDKISVRGGCDDRQSCAREISTWRAISVPAPLPATGTSERIAPKRAGERIARPR